MSILAVFLLVIHSVVNGDVALSGIFSSHMVLQIPDNEYGVRPTNIFGVGLLTDTIYITGSSGFPGPFKAKPNCTAEPGCVYGNFSVPIIPNMEDPSFPGPYNITVEAMDDNTGNISNTIVLTDVYFGETFLCGGQSNMAFQQGKCANYEYEKSISPYYPNIRMFMVFRTQNESLQQNVTYDPSTQNVYNWLVTGQSSDGNMYNFGCICYTFGRMMADYLTNISAPSNYVGLIESDTGGTSVYLWASPIACIACNATGQLPWEGQAGASPPGYKYNAMINPLGMDGYGISIREAIYYQGEADSGENDMFTSNDYICLLNGMIYAWRKVFNQPQLRFINIQLPNGHMPSYSDDDVCTKTGYAGLGTNWQGIQVAQNQVYTIQELTGLVTCQDYGQDTLHYNYKTEVTKRVYLWTRYLSFNDDSVTKYHLDNGIIPNDGENDSIKHPDPPIFINAYKTNPSNLTVLVNIANTGPNGMYLQPAYNCSVFPNNGYGPSTICDTNCTITYCCDKSGGNTIKFRLEGWYYYNHVNQTNKYIGLSNWFPGKVIKFINNNDNTTTVVTQPILPEKGCINWPRGDYQFDRFEIISVRQIEVGTTNDCVWSNTYGIPLSKGGPYDITVNDYSSK